VKLYCFKDAEKFNFFFFCFWLDLLFSRLLWNGLGELVSMMERDPNCSMDTFDESVDHGSCGGLLQSFLGSEGMWRRESYMKLAEMKEGKFWRVGRS